MNITKKNETARNLRVLYTDAERLELGKQLAGAHQDTEQIHKDFDTVKSDFKARLTAAEAKIGDLATKVGNGYRIELVRCMFVLDTPVKGKKTLIRSDTGEVVETVEMTQADLQSELPLAVPGQAKPEVSADGVVTVPADKGIITPGEEPAIPLSDEEKKDLGVQEDANDDGDTDSDEDDNAPAS